MTNRQIAKRIGAGPVGWMEFRGKEYVGYYPLPEKPAARPGYRLKALYPDYHVSIHHALDLLRWMNKNVKSDYAYTLYVGCILNCDRNKVLKEKFDYGRNQWSVVAGWEGDSIPAAVCAAFDAEFGGEIGKTK
jgi:hypothetical protein